MTFLNPLVLFGLVAAGIPLLIHLFNFRRPRRVDFSSLVFLRELQQTTMQRVRIKQWLLLLLRTAAIASLVLAFARPTLEGSVAGALGGEAESAVVVVVDNSMSMTVRDADGVLLDQALRIARELVGMTRPGDQVAIIPTITQPSWQPSWLKTRTAASDALSVIEARYGQPDLVASIGTARRLLEESNLANREIFVVSDLQASTFGEADGEPAPGGVALRLIPVGGSRVLLNAAVESVEVVSRIVEQNQPVRLRARISTATDAGQAPANIASVFLDGERVAQATIQAGQDAPVVVDFAVTPRESGWLRGEVRLEDDDFPVDNSRYFTLNVPEQRSVLLVRGPSFRSGYLELVLSSRMSPGRTRFDVTAIPSTQLSAATLSDFDVLVIAGVESFSSGEISVVADYVREGGGALLFPPASPSVGNFDQLLAALDGGSIKGLVGGTTGDTAAEVELVDLEHPLFEGVFDNSGTGAVKVERTEVFRYADYAASRPSEQTLMRLSSGGPFLQEMRPGAGRALFMTTLPDLTWSNLPVRGLFVPLLFRSLHYLSSGEAAAGGEVILGSASEVRITSGGAAAPVSVHAGDLDFVPPQRSVFGGTLITIGGELNAPGVADVVVDGLVARRVAVNADPREFDLRSIDPDAAADALGGQEAGVEVLRQDKDLSLAAKVQLLRTGVELWNVFLMVALAFLIAEMLVARHWNPEAAPG